MKEELKEELKAGDVVQLKTKNGPKMVVECVDAFMSRIHTVWFDTKFHHADFRVEALEQCAPDKPEPPPFVMTGLDTITTQPVVVPVTTPSVIEPPQKLWKEYEWKEIPNPQAIGVDSPAVPGKCMTFVPVEPHLWQDETDAPLWQDEIDALPKSSGTRVTPEGYVDMTIVSSTEPSPAQKAAQDALTTVKPDVLTKASGEPLLPPNASEILRAKNVQELAATLPADHPLAQAAAEPPKQRKRKQAGITLNTPAQEAEQAAVNQKLDDLQAAIAGGKQVAGSSTVEHSVDNREVAGPTPAPPTTPVKMGTVTTTIGMQITPTFPMSPTTDIPQSQRPLTPTLLPQPVTPPAVTKILTPEQETEIKTRLAVYRNSVLPNGGMVPVASVGGVEIQLRKFVAKFNPDKPSSKTWDYQDWLKFVGFLDDKVNTLGAAGLVKYMQQTIGVIQ
jgi:uncharacterized protein YodC (DUF2158 family)